MTIDIISYTEEQFAALTAEQLMEVREAQTKKDRLERQLEENLQKEKDKLVKQGIFNSGLFTLIQEKLQADYEREVSLVREGLLFYLRYSRGSEYIEGEAPYEVNYALSDMERFNVVKEYYERTYTNGTERFNVFKEDKIAVQYLGELYAPLYDFFLETA